jgi:hypothetical protein
MAAQLYLKPGDILLYRPKGTFGWLIFAKTWHKISHVEIYDGGYKSLASRDGIGVDRYPLRLTELAYVLRPQVPLNLTAGRAYFDSMKGTPYGWWDLLDFSGFNVDTKGIVCSPFAAGFLRACGWAIFPTDPVNKVAPFQFLDLIGAECAVAYDPSTLADVPLAA